MDIMLSIDQIKQTIQEADAILITAGAGIGVDVVCLILEEMRDFGKHIHL